MQASTTVADAQRDDDDTITVADLISAYEKGIEELRVGQRPLAQESLFQKAVALLVDGGRAIGVAVEALCQNGDRAEFVDDGGDADLNELSVSPILVGDVGGRDGVAGQGRPGSSGGPWLGGRVGPIEEQVGGIEVAVAGRSMNGAGRCAPRRNPSSGCHAGMVAH